MTLMCENGYSNEVICPSGIERLEVVTLTGMDDIILVEVDKSKTDVVSINEYVKYLQTKFPDNRIVLMIDGMKLQVRHKDILV